MPNKAAALYLRISQDRKGEGLAVERQREDGTNLVRLRGFDLVGEFVDNDISAAGKRTRPGFNALLEAIRAERVQVVVAWSFDRLTRNRRDELRLIETCQAFDVGLCLVRGSDIDLSTAAGRLVGDVLASAARHEIDQKSERQLRAMEQAAQAGKWSGGSRPFGFAYDAVDHHPVEAPLVREVYARFLAGAGPGELGDWLNHHAPTPRGLRWTSKAVRGVLGNPRNAGRRGFRTVDKRSGTRPRWHEQTWPAVWEPIVSEETWRAAVAKLRRTARPGLSPGGRQPRHLLSGIATCGLCGDWMISHRSQGERRYVCRSNRHISRMAQAVEDYVVEALLTRLRWPDATVHMLPEPDTDLAELREEATVVRERLDGLAIDYAEGVLDRRQMQIASDRLQARLTDLDKHLAAAGAVDVVGPLIDAVDPEEVWEGYPLSTQRLVIEQVMQVRILRGTPGRPKGGVFDISTVEITWK